MLLDLADRFEGISFRTPILSVFELKESKNSSISLRPKYQQVSLPRMVELWALINSD
ncbi:putative Tetratricopeptide repeat domain-containing protein, partial [Seiridium unicorne]